MRYSLLLIVALVTVAAPVAPSAQGYGTIGVFSEPSGCNCYVDDPIMALTTLYVVHRDIADGVTGSRFIVQGAAGMTMIFISDASIGGPIYITGSIVEGYEVFYGSCITGGLAVMILQYFGQGNSAPCSRLEVVAAPTSTTGGVDVFDCGSGTHLGTGHYALVNADGSCTCDLGPCSPVPVEQTTWGGIKALYQ